MKHFLVILFLTVLVWLGISMSERHEYPISVSVQLVGYDTVRYAATHADTVLPVHATLNGFDALLLSIRHPHPEIRVQLPPDQTAVEVNTLMPALRRIIPGATHIASPLDTLRIYLSPRASRTYRPSLHDVHFTFSQQHGLYGQPRISPAEVTLYGPQETLDLIEELPVMPANFHHIDTTAYYILPLQPVWEQYPDIHPSVKEVTLLLPVQAYVEKQYSIPIQVVGADTNVSLRLYPDHAVVRAWVAQCDLRREADITVVVPYDQFLASSGRLKPRIAHFPDFLRPRSIEPAEIQCVVIK